MVARLIAAPFSRSVFFAILALNAAPPSECLAQGREEAARTLAEEGRLAEARALLVEELGEAPTASVAFNLALIEHSAGDFEEAEALFGRLLGGEFGDLPEDRRIRTIELMALSSAELATLVVQWRGTSEGTLRIDGRPRGALVPGETFRIRLNPVPHIVSFRSGGIERAQEVSLERGGTHEVVFGPATAEGPRVTREEIVTVDPTGPAPEPRPLRRSPWLWTAIALVVAGGITATVLLTRPTDEPVPDGYLGRVDF